MVCQNLKLVQAILVFHNLLYIKMWISYFSIDFDYFSKHYEEEIIENGIVCRDTIRLAMELNKNV